MLICGLKLTHDGAIAVVEDGKLLFSIEMEKINNNIRFKQIEETSVIEEILTENGIKLEQIDYFVVDGWGGTNQGELAIQPRLEISELCNKISAKDCGQDYKLDVNSYEEESRTADVLSKIECDGLWINGKKFPYSSYLHVAGHIMSSYATSPFASKGEDSYILVWDGGMYPRLYYFDAKTKKIENLGPIFLLIGNTYTIFSQHFGPYKVQGNFAKDSLSIAGKVMAYIALGTVKEELFEIFDKIYNENYTTPMGFANVLANKFKDAIADKDYKDEDILATFHVYLQNMLISKLAKKIDRHDKKCNNLCIAGGCALNIKWNSAIRNTGMFKEVYVPPFPNDSGSAIGMACCTMLEKTGISNLEWSVYSGPKITKSNLVEGWNQKPCTIEELAKLLYEKDEPVVFLNGRAELGPRALGNRSILASASSKNMKDILNMVKKRESYRPVSPICLEDRAKEIFNPGISDQYMLFDHIVKEEWKDKVPAICHLDGTARLQTITENQNQVIAKLLRYYESLSNIPLLCNTSANYNGSGFFPNAESAMKWGRVNYVWHDNILYEKEVKTQFN